MAQPNVIILKEGTSETKGKGAQANNIAAAKAVADAVRSTLGPRGMDKMLVDSMGDVLITNDGATILKEIELEHPAAKMIAEVAKTQDQECGDGTTTAVILAGELLKQAESLVEQNIHPTIIVQGYRHACDLALDRLNLLSMSASDDDMLRKIASTAMNSKSIKSHQVQFSQLVLEAIRCLPMRAGRIDLDELQIMTRPGGALTDTCLVRGILLDKELPSQSIPKRLTDCSIALVEAAIDPPKTRTDAKYEFSGPEQLQRAMDAEDQAIRAQVQAIVSSGAHLVVCQGGIDDTALHYLAKAGLAAIRRVKGPDMTRLVKITGAKIASRALDLTAADLGEVSLFEERALAAEKVAAIEGRGGTGACLLIRGGTESVIAEVERALHDALCVVRDVLEDGRITTGGGSMAMELAQALRGTTAGGREMMAIDAFAAALEVIPKALAENAGHSPLDALLALRKAHSEGRVHDGVGMATGAPIDMLAASVVEPLRVGLQALQSATDVACMLLRIDDVIAAKRQSQAPQEPPQ